MSREGEERPKDEVYRPVEPGLMAACGEAK